MTSPLINRLVIAGFGLIGSSLARAIRNHPGLVGHITAVDRDPAALKVIRELSLADDATDDVAAAEAMLLACRPEGYAGCCAALRDTDLREDCGRIVAPTLVISGRHDQATPPEQSEALVSNIAGAKLVVLDAAHLSCIEQADLFNAELSRFIG